jgi:hypothetical protein
MKAYGAACAAAYKADAERYRWLKEHRVSENDEGEKCIYFWCDFEHFNDVDAAIDGARGEREAVPLFQLARRLLEKK